MKRRTGQISWELRCRYAVTLTWIVGVTFMEHLPTIAATGFLAIAFLTGCGISPKRVFRRLLYAFPFLAISFVTLAFSDGWPITREATQFALLLVARITACVVVIHLVAFDDIREHLNCFCALKCPDVLASTLFLTQRYLYVIGRQLGATRNALASRLFTPDFRAKSMNVYGQMVGGMTVRAIDRSEQVRKAMESRGFQGKIPTAKPVPMRKNDLLKSVAAIMVLIIILIADKRWF